MKRRPRRKPAKPKSKISYCLAAAIILILAAIFFLAQQEPVSVNGKTSNGKDSKNDLNAGIPNADSPGQKWVKVSAIPTKEQVVARLRPHLDAEAELANSSYLKSPPTVELLSEKALAQKAIENPAIYAEAKAGNYEIRYNDLFVLFDFDANLVVGMFIIDNVTIGDQNTLP